MRRTCRIHEDHRAKAKVGDADPGRQRLLCRGLCSSLLGAKLVKWISAELGGVVDLAEGAGYKSELMSYDIGTYSVDEERSIKVESPVS